MSIGKNIEFVKIDRGYKKEAISCFLQLGHTYLAEVDFAPADNRGRFLQSMLERQDEPDRWLFLLRRDNGYIGFAHAKIDRDERQGWGCILEFYILPAYRKLGYGTRMFGHIMETLINRGINGVGLTSVPDSEGFWRSVGFVETGEVAPNRQKVMVRRGCNVKQTT